MRNNAGITSEEDYGRSYHQSKRPQSGKINGSQKGVYGHHAYHEDEMERDQEQNHSGANRENKEIEHDFKKSGQYKHRQNIKKYEDQEDELSSLSGFTASDHEEQEDIKFKMAPKGKKKNKYDVSDNEEEWDIENRDIVLNPQDDIKERFMQHEYLRKKNEEERRQKGVLTSQNPENVQNVPLKRPYSSHGVLKGTDNNQNQNTMSRTFTNTQKENVYQTRPQTAYQDRSRNEEEEEEEERKPVTFKPIYTKTIQQTLIEKKVFNYTDKKFKTIAKKSDPVSRFNAFRSEWNKTKFLKANNNKKEGRKLNLAERNQTSKPEFIFHRYLPKYSFD